MLQWTEMYEKVLLARWAHLLFPINDSEESMDRPTTRILSACLRFLHLFYLIDFGSLASETLIS